jgi:two-component system CheB/CheR fusion protein
MSQSTPDPDAADPDRPSATDPTTGNQLPALASLPDTTDSIITSVGLSFQASKLKFGFPVIGIGASAGGLESIESLFENVPSDTNAAFVIVQHLSPDFKSMMDEILSRRTKMRVRRIENEMAVEPETIYLIPPKADLEIEQEKLFLREREIRQGLNHPIDRFFSSLAKSRGPACAAVILSGSGSDGSRGIRDVCEAGGMVLVESPDRANFDGMPRAAMETGVADFAGDTKQIAVWLSRFIGSFSDPTKVGRYTDTGDYIDREPAKGLARVIELLKHEYQINFSQYKPNMIVRRIERRWHLLHFGSIEEYIELLESDPGELNRLYRDLLIGVTRFFRDSEAFDQLTERVLPELIAQCQSRTLRVWTPGCATGEEAYSLAMTIVETMEAIGRFCDVKIFATDAHRLSLEKAGTGTYSVKELNGVSEERLERHFQPVGSGYQVTQKLRKMIVFAPQNLLNDAAFTNIDLVVCRNTLIYFGDLGQRRALSLMHFGLRLGGFLFLGPSETPVEIQADYETVSRRWRVYKKIGTSRLGVTSLRAPERVSVHRADASARTLGSSGLTDRMILNAIEGIAHEYLPPTFVADADFKLLYSTPGSAIYLRRQEGRFGSTLPELLLPVLKTSVLVGLQRCARQSDSQNTVVIGQVAVPEEQLLAPVLHAGDNPESGQPERADSEKPSFRQVSILIRRVDLAVKGEHGFSVTVTQTSSRPSAKIESSDVEQPIDLSAQATLEEELRHTKESLQSTIQELETSNEELQATNEEMVASNEELQSTNEELHSVNEELYTVNAEHQSKIEELTEITEDMENLFRSTNVATVFLDDESRIRRMTPQAMEIFGLTHEDTGRRLDNFRNPLNDEELYDVIDTSITSREPTEREVLGLSGERYLLRLIPYKSSRDVSGGVLTLVSLQHLEKARQQLEAREARFRGTFENAAVGIAHVGLDGEWLLVNETLCQLVGYTREELLAMDFQTITHPDDLNSDLTQFEDLKSGDINSYTLRKRYIHKQGHEVHIDLTVSMQVEPGTDRRYCISVIEDATERVRFQRDLEKAIRQRDHFLAVLSHELRNPLGAVKNAIALVRRTGEDAAQREDLVELLDRQTTHMSRLVDDLLDTSRITENKISLQRDLLDLGDLAEACVDSMRSTFVLKEQQLTLERGDAAFPIVGDSVRLMQAIENLLVNANRYTQFGGEIVVRLTTNDGRVLLSVSDNGQGISAENLDSIFSMFIRGQETEETQGGLGVGLALAKMLVEKHEGSLTVASEGPGRGAMFTISLPIVPVPKGYSLSRDEPRPSAETNYERYKILLVEDDADARDTLAKILTLDGHEIETARDGHDGLKKILELDPDFALVDLSMPGLSGHELIRQLREESPDVLSNTHLIALTGHGQPADIQRTREAGFSGHLIKPIDLQKLDSLLSQLKS